jgi:hypothetical protein
MREKKTFSKKNGKRGKEKERYQKKRVTDTTPLLKTPILKKTMKKKKKKKKKQRACSQQQTSNGRVGSFVLVLVAKQTTIWPSRMNALLYGRKVYLDANGGRDGSVGVFCVWCLEMERNGRVKCWSQRK